MILPLYTYIGFFTKGKKEGHGVCEWQDGSKYEGTPLFFSVIFFYCVPWFSRWFIYVYVLGNWRDDKRQGIGKYSCEAFQYLFLLHLIDSSVHHCVDMTESGQMIKWKARVKQIIRGVVVLKASGLAAFAMAKELSLIQLACFPLL